MADVDEEIIILVKRLAKTIKKVGVAKVVEKLDELNTEEGFIEAHKQLIKYIIKETSLSFQVNSEDLKKKNIRGITVDARSMCFILLKKHLDLAHKDIIILFSGKSHAVVSNALRQFNSLNYDIKKDRKFLEIFQKLDKQVEEQKNILWAKHS